MIQARWASMTARSDLVGVDRKRDAVGDVEAELLAEVVERTHELAGDALGRRSSSSSRSSATAQPRPRPARTPRALGPDLDLVGGQPLARDLDEPCSSSWR